MNNRKLPLLFAFSSLIAILLVSGCIGQSTSLSGSSSGIVIKNIYTDPQQDLIETGDDLNIFYELENIGGTTATNVKTTIYGLTWIPENDRMQNYCFPTPSCTQGYTLYPPDPITKSPGGIQAINIKIPIRKDLLPAGLKKTFPLNIRSSYDYKTLATATLQGYSKNRYNRDIQLGNQQPVIAEASIPIQKTIADTPISITITGPDKMIVHDVNNFASFKFTYRITFSNIGQGYPITNNEEGVLMIKSLKIEGPGVSFSDCLDQSTQSKELNGIAVKLRGPSVTKSCTIQIDNSKASEDSWFNREFNTLNMYFDIDYRYFVEKEFSISITAPISGEGS